MKAPTGGLRAEAAPDPKRRKVIQQVGTAAGGLALAGASYPFLVSLLPSERARAQGSPVEVDLSRMAPGALAMFEWRGKPVCVARATARSSILRGASIAARRLPPISSFPATSSKVMAG
jgi:Rieske Fe-S protein